MTRTHTPAVALVIACVCGLSLMGCGGNTTTDASQASRPPGATATAPTNSGRCPLTAEQVSRVLGTAVKGPDSSCSFFPIDDKAWPNAGYNRQTATACSGNLLAQLEYKEKLAGLPHDAYVNDRADGTWVLVCRGSAPFEIRVDAPEGQDKARAAALALARTVLGI